MLRLKLSATSKIVFSEYSILNNRMFKLKSLNSNNCTWSYNDLFKQQYVQKKFIKTIVLCSNTITWSYFQTIICSNNNSTFIQTIILTVKHYKNKSMFKVITIRTTNALLWCYTNYLNILFFWEGNTNTNTNKIWT